MQTFSPSPFTFQSLHQLWGCGSLRRIVSAGFLSWPLGDCSVRPRGGGTVSAASSDPCRVLQAAAGLGRPQPGPAARRKGLEPRAPSSGSSRWRVCASGWGCGGEEGGGEARGRVRRRRQRPTCGQLKKSRLGLPQNLWELRAGRTARAEQSRAAAVAAAAWRCERRPDCEHLYFFVL